MSMVSSGFMFSLSRLRAGVYVAIAIVVALPILANTASPDVNLRLSPLVEGFDIHLGEEWPDGCLPVLKHVDVNWGTVEVPGAVDVTLESGAGECEDQAARPWTLNLKLSPVVLPDPEVYLDTFRVRVWWRREGATESMLLAEDLGKVVPYCIPTDALCLQQGRFYVTATFGGGATLSPAHPIHTTADSGAFWFFNQANPELFVKVLDGCAAFDHFWVFASGLTDVATNIRVLDRWTSQIWEHSTPRGVGFESVRDTDAFATCDATRPEVPAGLDWSDFHDPVVVPGPEGSVLVKLGNIWRSGCTPTIKSIDETGNLIHVTLLSPADCPSSTFPWRAELRIDGLAPGDYTVEVENLTPYQEGTTPPELLVSKEVSVTWDQNDPLCNRPEVACTADQRFATRVWYTTEEEEKEARTVGLTTKGAGFWFFRPGNLEVIVKVLDACRDFDRFWVFTSGLTDVGVRMEVLDRWTGETWDLVNPPGEGFPAFRDTDAFATCGTTTPQD